MEFLTEFVTKYNLYIEIVASVMGVIYVSLEIMQKKFMWVMCLITAVCYFIVYIAQGLYAMMSLQIYYIVISIITFVKWGRIARSGIEIKGSEQTGFAIGDDEKDTIIIIQKMDRKQLIISLLMAIAVFFALGFIFKWLTDNPRPFFDSFAATLCMLATYWMTKKYIEQWYVWVICNAFSIYLYVSMKMIPTTILYVAYLAMAIYGIVHWKRKGIVI